MGTRKRPDGTVPWMPGFRYGALLPALSLNLLVRDTAVASAFYRDVLNAEVHYADIDFAAIRVGDVEVMLHADHTHDTHPWYPPLIAGVPRPYLVNYTGGSHPPSKANRPETRDKDWDEYKDPESAVGFYVAFLGAAFYHACCVGGPQNSPPVTQSVPPRRLPGGIPVGASAYLRRGEPCGCGWEEPVSGFSNRPRTSSANGRSLELSRHCSGLSPPPRITRRQRRGTQGGRLSR